MDIVLFLMLALGDLWVYVEKDPQPQSQHVLEALQSPIQTLYQRNPSQQVARYLDDLEWSRASLLTEGTLQIIDRDEAKLSSSVKLPAWSLSPRELPQEFHPQCFLHWQLVPDYLTYIRRIHRYGLQAKSSWGTFSFGGTTFPCHRKWFSVHKTSRSEPVIIEGVPTECLIETNLVRPRIPTFLPIQESQLPIGVTRRTEWNTINIWGVSSESRCENISDEHVLRLVKLMDADTGIIYLPPPIDGPR
jgi:hypothetical protein